MEVRVTEKIRSSRKEHGWSQTVLAQKTNIPQTTISNIENGRFSPRINHVYAIAKAFEMTVSEFLNDVTEFDRDDATASA